MNPICDAHARAFIGKEIGRHCRWQPISVVAYVDFLRILREEGQVVVDGSDTNFHVMDGGTVLWRGKAFHDQDAIDAYARENAWDYDFNAVASPKHAYEAFHLAA